MNRVLASTAIGVLTYMLVTPAFADLKPEDQIEFRQAGYSFMAWNMIKIKDNLQGEFNQDQVANAANVISAIANSGMGALFGPGTDQAAGGHKTRAKPELFKPENGEEVGRLAREFIDAADNLAEVAAEGDKDAVQTAFGDLGKTCKNCHEKFRANDDD
ncbi:cytochrome c [Chromatium okenii]|uniref:c-type cytochrome n=1 Tax=Chromatium okenii TaxID=61644 RepID=UPI0026F2AA2C|nr:cytochrome c [Chromatium okenii]MBV5309365.1 cytochrome c [Chromatium okenii]